MRDEGLVCNLVGIGSNLALAAVKFAVGVAAGSAALLADAWHSVGDTLQTVVTAIGYHAGKRPADEGHPFGHGNFETLAALTVSLVLLGTGVFVVFDAVTTLVRGAYSTPGLGALPIALASVVAKEALARYTLRVGRRLNSPAITVSGKDHRADALTSIAAVAGIGGAQFGSPVLDPVAGLVIGVLIGVMAFPSLRDSISILMDAAPRGDLARRIEARFAGDPDVRRVHRVRIHPIGSYYDIDLEIDVEGDLTVRRGHEIAHRVRDTLLRNEPFVSEVKVHVNPHPEGDGAVQPKRPGAPTV